MKKCMVILYVSGTLILAGNVLADPPTTMRIRFDCPLAADRHHPLVNYGNIIAGEGKRRFITPATDYQFVQFSSGVIVMTNIPANIADGNYLATSTSYLQSGLVTCHYTSSLNFAPFDVHYQMTNGNGGTQVRARQHEIYISLNVGLKNTNSASFEQRNQGQ